MRRQEETARGAAPSALARGNVLPGPGAPDAGRAGVLMVDDRADRLQALEAGLADLGDQVELVRARSGKEALRHLLRQDFAVILLDVHMPVMDGFETAALIRQRHRSEHTPIIFITALGPNETQVTQGYALGAVDYIFAPVVAEVLRAKVAVFIDLYRKTEQVKRQAEWLRAEAERRAAHLETRLRGLLEGLEVGVFRATPEGRIVEANPALLALLGRSSVEEASEAARDGLLAGGEGGCRARDLRIVRPDGSERWLTLSTTQSRGGDGEFHLDGIVEDVTARKTAEERLKSAHATLEAQTRELARSNADLQRFAYVVSHDLQEPLRMVATFTDLLARRYRDRLDEDARLYIQYACEAAGRMQGMIHGLLEFCVLETTNGRHRDTDCGEVLDKVVSDLRVAIQESGAKVTRGHLPVVSGDDVHLAHVFQNLVANALKFRRAGTAPRVHVGAEKRGAEWVFSVRDNGIGIDPASADRLFMIFRRLPGAERFPGCGMGLAICKRILERHGGRIWMEPAPGGGSVFLFTFPAASGPAEGAVADGTGRDGEEVHP